MSSDPKWSFRIRHILDAIARIQQYTAGRSEETFAAEQMAVDAVIRNFQVLGEAARLVPDDVRKSNPNIPWSDMQKMRHVLVHHYDKVDVSRVWQTVQQDLPPLVEPLGKLLEDNP
jgi:uncharacterized protein with HEPN domain